MKHKKILLFSLAFIISAATIIGLAQTSLAANLSGTSKASSTLNQFGRHGRSGEMVNNIRGNKEGSLILEADRLKKQEAVEAALSTNNYEAWVIAVGSNSPLLTKINKDNFSKFVQAHQLRKQADIIMTELGLDRGMGQGLMKGRGNK